MKYLVILLILISCNNLDYVEINHKNSPEKETYKEYPKIEHGQKFETAYQIIKFVASNIDYKSEPDGVGYWQSPWETWNLKTGDCEDFCILAMWLLKIELNVDSKMTVVYLKDKKHAMLEIKNSFVDTTNSTIFSNFEFNEKFKIIKQYSFIEILSLLNLYF